MRALFPFDADEPGDLGISQSQNRRQELYRELELFTDALDFVQAQYVDETKPKDLIYGALSGMLANLDAHSQFYCQKSTTSLRSTRKANSAASGSR